MEAKNRIFFISVITIITIIIGVTLYLCFGRTKTSFQVVFDSDGGTNIESQKIKKDELVKKPSNPIRDGYIFIEWLYENKTFDFSIAIDKDVKLIAKWQKINNDIDNFIIQFDTDGGTTISNQVLGKNEKVVKPKDPVKTGYTFVGWFVSGKEYKFDEEVKDNLTILAKWEQPKTFEVKFNSNSGTTVNTQNVTSGKKAVKPINPTRIGYKFSMWKLDDKEYKFDEPVTGNIYLTAIWIKIYIVSFDSDGGNNIENQSIPAGEKVKKPADPTKTGYVFKEWKLDNILYNFDTSVNKDITLIASWNKECTITFDSKGGSEITKKVIFCGEKLDKPTNPTKAGYTFKEWKLNGTTYDFNNIVNDNITLEAIWEENTYTITFATKGGSSISNQTVKENGLVTKPTDPTKTGYIFKSWNLGEATYDFNSKVTKNITLQAVWQPITYKIKYNGNGSENGEVASTTCTYGVVCTLASNDFTKIGFIFVGWTTVPNDDLVYNIENQPINLASVQDAEVTLYAKWIGSPQ